MILIIVKCQFHGFELLKLFELYTTLPMLITIRYSILMLHSYIVFLHSSSKRFKLCIHKQLYYGRAFPFSYPPTQTMYILSPYLPQSPPNNQPTNQSLPHLHHTNIHNIIIVANSAIALSRLFGVTCARLLHVLHIYLFTHIYIYIHARYRYGELHHRQQQQQRASHHINSRRTRLTRRVHGRHSDWVSKAPCKFEPTVKVISAIVQSHNTAQWRKERDTTWRNAEDCVVRGRLVTYYLSR